MAKLQKGINDLQTWCLKNGEFGQQLLQEWTGQCLDDNKQYAIDEVARGTAKKFRWKCSKDPSHVWEKQISARAYNKSGCPYCVRGGPRVTKENSLLTWCNSNGSYGQRLLQEWTGLCLDDNKTYTTDGVTKGSHKKFSWKCSKDPSHIWDATVAHRTKGSGCPYCNKYGTSYPEQVIYRSLKQVFPNTISRGKFQGYEFDISIPETKTYIEYNGMYWHKDKFTRDSEKAQLCENHNINFIQIYAHSGETSSEDIYEPDFILYKVDNNNHNNQLKNIVSQILTQFNHSIDEVDFNKACEEAFEYEGSVQEGVNDLKTWCQTNGSYGQQILNEWTGQCLTNGKYYNPDEVTKASNKKFRWKCSKDPYHVWDALVYSRTNGSGCPYCSGQKVSTENSLQTWCKTKGSYGQQILNEWTGLCIDDNKKYRPDEVTKEYYKKFKWRCFKNPSHIWDTTVASRTNGSGCPYCHRVSEENSLLTWCQTNSSYGQQLLQEWTGLCLDDNKQYTIDSVTKASGKRFRWKCSKNPSHIWDATVNNRTNGQGCPYCSGRNVSEENSLLTWCQSNGEFGQQLLREWVGFCLDDNKQYTPDKIARGTTKKFRWQCSKNPSHIWDATVYSRTNGSGCPYCHRVSEDNSLLTWCQNNGSYGQQLLQEWTGLCIDDNKQYTTDGVTKAFGKRFRWRCSKNPSHIWDATVNNRTNGCGCTYCARRGMRVTKENSLLIWCQSNGDYGQQLLQEWTGLCLDDNKQYITDEVAKGSHKKFRWKCSNGHKWVAEIAKRTKHKTSCPHCARKRKK